MRVELRGDPLDSLRLWAAMCWPGDEGKRREFLAVNQASILCDLRTIPEFALFEAVIHAPSFEDLASQAAARARGGQVAGRLLLFLIAMHLFDGKVEPSLRKAKLWIQKSELSYHDGKRVVANDGQMHTYWNDFAPTIHLWGSYVIHAEHASETNFLGADPLTFARVAAVLGAVAQRMKEPIVGELAEVIDLYGVPITHAGELGTNTAIDPELSEWLSQFFARHYRKRST
ncbi:MAG: hypothetical protein ACREVK_11225 [Gammaproteobacteria bacterium]